MLDLRRKLVKVRSDRREHPRIEIRCPIKIHGLDIEATIVDLSLSGFYIETNSTDQIQLNKHIDLIVQLPTEKNAMLLRAKVISIQKKGIGCMLSKMNADKLSKLRKCFSVHKQMLPIV